MKINEDKYPLPKDNYLEIENSKAQIVIGNTYNNNMRHIIGWLNRYNGGYKKTAPFTIDQQGNVYQHFDPKYQSRFFNNEELDGRSIVILLENEGWVEKDVENNNFITWLGDIYNGDGKIVKRKWRGHEYWCSYTEEQLNSCIELVQKICNDFTIPLVSVNHNTKIDGLTNYEGVLYRSNLDKEYKDVNPTWDFDGFKNKIELKID